METLLGNLAKEAPFAALLVLACWALWQQNARSNTFLAQLLDAQTKRNQELANQIQGIATGVATSNEKVALAVEALSRGISELRMLLAARPCIAADLEEEHPHQIHAQPSHRSHRAGD